MPAQHEPTARTAAAVVLAFLVLAGSVWGGHLVLQERARREWRPTISIPQGCFWRRYLAQLDRSDESVTITARAMYPNGKTIAQVNVNLWQGDKHL